MVTRQMGENLEPILPAPTKDRRILVHPLADLNEILSRTPVDLNHLGRQLARYPALAKEVLSGCRVSFPDDRVTTTDEAVLHLGVERIRVLLMSAVLVEFCRSRLSAPVGRRFLQEAQVTARFSESLARMTGYSWPERASLAGLLHDAGRLLLLPACTMEEGLALLDCQECGGIALEQERFGTDHIVLGKWLGTQWKLQESVIEVITHHHYPQNAWRDPQLVNIVALAGWIAREEIRRGSNAGAPLSAGVLPDEVRAGEME